jgi:TonB family protein
MSLTIINYYLNNTNMKKSFPLLALLLSFTVWQACGPKVKEADTESIAQARTQAEAEARTVETARIEAVASRKAMLLKESARKAEERTKAAAEKAKLALTYRDASGKVVYNKAEIDPSYIGGMSELQKYLKDNIKYPTDARDKGVEGTVFVDFVIDNKGRVREVIATDVVGENVDLSLKEESVRVVATMPAWKPGTQHGKAVDTAFSIPITFELQD